MKPNALKVNLKLVDEALKRANGDKRAAYSNYIKLCYRQTGRLAPGCDNKDLQAYYDSLKSEV